MVLLRMLSALLPTLVLLTSSVDAIPSPPLLVLLPPPEIVYTLGQNVTLKCEAEGRPKPTFGWVKNGDIFVENAKSGDLTFTMLTEANEGHYQCFANNSLGLALTHRVDFRMAKLEKFPSITAGASILQQVVKLGQSLALNCPHLNASLPQPRIVWRATQQDAGSLIAGAWLPVELSKRIVQDVEGNLHFTSVEQDDTGKMYQCVAHNPKAVPTSSEGGLQVVKLDTAEADPVVDTDPEVLYVSSKKNIVLFGDTIHIQCIFAGRPTPDITWRRVNSTMPPTAIFLNDNYELVIPNATFRHSGKYECIATNSVGTKSYRTRIVVQSKPYFIEPWVPFIEGLKFGTYQLECPVAGVPPVSILWYRNGVPFYPKPDSDPFHLIRGKFGDRLVFEKAVPEMTGVYQCNASNIHGNIFANAFVNIADCPICPQRPFPICGSDGNTYKNSCFMRMKNCIEDTDIQPVLCGPCINTTSGDAEGPPSAPSDTHLQSCSYGKRGKEELSDSIAEVMWQQSNGYCVPILNYIVEVKNTTSNASAAWEILYDNIPGDILRVTAKLPPVGNYRLRVRAITEIGVSKPSRETSECPGRGGGQSIDISDANRNTDDSAPGSGVSRTVTCGAIAWPLLFAILRHFW